MSETNADKDFTKKRWSLERAADWGIIAGYVPVIADMVTLAMNRPLDPSREFWYDAVTKNTPGFVAHWVGHYGVFIIVFVAIAAIHNALVKKGPLNRTARRSTLMP
jgi:hypothetical protein